MHPNWSVIWNELTFTGYFFESRLTILMALLVLIGLLFGLTHFYWKRIYYFLISHPNAVPIFKFNQSLKYAARDLLFIFKVLLIIYVICFIGRILTEQPRAISVSPAEYTRLDTAAPVIEIQFTVPVSHDDLKLHVSPDIKGEWVWEEPQFGLYQKVRFFPAESFYPGSRVVVYIVGMHPAWYPWKSHEQALSYDAPGIPWVKEITPAFNTTDIAIDTEILVNFNSPIGDFVDIQFEIHPDPGNLHIESHDTQITLIPENKLAQDHIYTIDVYQTPRSYQVATNTTITAGDTIKIGSTAFKTVASPLIESYMPNGNSVLADSTIQIVFDQEMDQRSVANYFVVDPIIVGKIEWNAPNSFIYKYTDSLAKNTEYTLILGAGIKSLAGGTSEQDLKLKFKTVGAVEILSVNPISGATGVRHDLSEITIEFDQEVNHASAQTKFYITPNIPGNFDWNENILTYKPTQQFSYGKTYTFGFLPGIETIYGLDSTQTYNYSFTTRQNILTLGIPYFSQEESFTCNIAATRMALAYRGINLSEDAIQNAIGYGSNPDQAWVNGYGVHTGPVASFINQYRNTSVKTGWNLTDLLREVQNGNPVILWWYNRYSQPAGSFSLSDGSTGYNGMHSEVVRGFVGDINAPTQILTNDPWRGQLTYSRAQFENTWGYIGNTAIVVY